MLLNLQQLSLVLRALGMTFYRAKAVDPVRLVKRASSSTPTRLSRPRGMMHSSSEQTEQPSARLREKNVSMIARPHRSEYVFAGTEFEKFDDIHEIPTSPSESLIFDSDDFAGSLLHLDRTTQSTPRMQSMQAVSGIELEDLHDGNSQLAAIVESQKQLMVMFKDVSQRVGALENTMKTINSPSSSSSSGEKTKRIPSQLTKMVGMIHEALDDKQHFKPELGSKNPHNVKVKSKIKEEIHERKENEYGVCLIERAVQRYFESRRRNWRETTTTDPKRQEKILLQSMKRRIRSRQQRLYARRAKSVLPGEEEDRFGDLTLEYMSEESDPDENGQIAVHQPKWRSKKLTDFLRCLDSRADSVIKDSKKHSAERKVRVLAIPLNSTPPQDAPAWTLSSKVERESVADHEQ